MSTDEFNALFDSFRNLTFRLETLPAYDVGGEDAERLAAFQAGRALPERSVRTSPWLARIARSVVGGKSWERVRVLDDPLTDYQRYELQAYQESQAAGEQIMIVPRTQAEDWDQDFWLFDPDTSDARAVAMDYTPDGRWRGAVLVTDQRQVQSLSEIRRVALSRAVMLNEFIATAGA
jgi:hypothetical protein